MLRTDEAIVHAELGLAPPVPPSVLLRYASLTTVVVVALAGVLAWEGWAAYQAGASLQGKAPVALTVLAGALPPALGAWLAVLARMRRQLQQHERSGAGLRESEAHHRALFQANPLPMWLYDLDSLVILAVNEGAIRQYGYAREQFVGMTLEELHPQDHLAGLLGRIEELRAGGGAGFYATRHRRKDGTFIDVEVSGSTVTFDGRYARLVTCVDVTERQRLEEQLRQAQKMDAVGQLARGAA